MFASSASMMDAVFQVILLLGVIIGVLVIFLSMYTSVTERTREIGILRSMGATKTFILKLVLEESLLICITGTVVGIALSVLVAALLGMPILSILITLDWVLRAVAAALASGVLGSLYPALRAAWVDPIEALAHE